MFAALLAFIPLFTVVLMVFLVILAPLTIRGRRPRGILPVPISDHILILPITRPQEVGGMARPLSATERPTEGRVVLVGPGKVTERGVRVRPEVSPGDGVSFPSFAGQTVVDPPGVAPGTYLLVRQDELWLNHGPIRPQSTQEEQ